MKPKTFFLDKKTLVNGSTDSYVGMANPLNLKQYISDVIDASPISPPSLVLASNGSVGAPSVTFATNPNTGIYHYGTDLVGISGGGYLGLVIGSTGIATAALSSLVGAQWPITVTGGIRVTKSAVTQITSLVTGVTTDNSAATITTVSATTVAGASFTFVVTNPFAKSDSVITLNATTGGAGLPYANVTNKTNGNFSVTVHNIHPSAAFNATILIDHIIV